MPQSPLAANLGMKIFASGSAPIGMSYVPLVLTWTWRACGKFMQVPSKILAVMTKRWVEAQRLKKKKKRSIAAGKNSAFG